MKAWIALRYIQLCQLIGIPARFYYWALKPAGITK